MLRFGVVTREGLFRAIERRAKTPPAVAFPLVATFAGPLSESEEEALALLYGSIPAGESVKLTWRERLRPVDDLILAEIDKRFAKDRPIRVHDMAASNAITSVDFFARLAATGREIDYLASDFYDALRVVSLPGGRWRVVFNAEGEALQIIGRRMVLSAAGERKRHTINRVIHLWAKRNLVPKAEERLRRGEGERITLFHPEAIALAERDHRFVLRREDVFHPPPGPFEVVKVMSFLTGRRYEAEAAQQAIKGVATTVVEGGVLALGRTQGMKNRLDASLFAKDGGRLVPIAQIGDGYDHKSVVAGL